MKKELLQDDFSHKLGLVYILDVSNIYVEAIKMPTAIIIVILL
ncbi:hypothetical protein GARC_0599 [Paraglaciecola arctica BSs20135]|uniref:Uncharacterized protein n=1 Tax=Paraglaciecola arctica BSs20135 TaxID=493475 RepID=K6Z287_9ALTE|nr:hypothetical protein GARC_0599 [Paraglaciecola arctica BSs20135]